MRLTKGVLMLVFFALVATSVLASEPNSLVFNETTYVTVPDNAKLDVNSGAFTYSVWIYPRSYDNNVLPRILEKRSTYMAIMGDKTNSRYGKLAVELASPAGNTVEFWGSRKLALETWQHVAFVYDGVNGSWYYNGKPMESTKMIEMRGNWTGDEKSTSGAPFYIGRRGADLSRNFHGNLDEVRIYNRMLSPEEINHIAQNKRYRNPALASDGLVAWYPFDEAKGTVLNDQSGNGLTGTITGGKWTY